MEDRPLIARSGCSTCVHPLAVFCFPCGATARRLASSLMTAVLMTTYTGAGLGTLNALGLCAKPPLVAFVVLCFSSSHAVRVFSLEMGGTNNMALTAVPALIWKPHLASKTLSLARLWRTADVRNRPRTRTMNQSNRASHSQSAIRRACSPLTLDS